MDNLIIFGSAVTRDFRHGKTEPHDIDVLYTGDMGPAGKELIDKWSLDNYGAILPIDLHKTSISDNNSVIPVLDTKTTQYVHLTGDAVVKPVVRKDGFASTLRLHGHDLQAFRKHINPKNEYMSLLPPGYKYWDWGLENNDKYYSGLLAFRNACAHCEPSVLDGLNCSALLKRLLLEDPVNWVNNPEVGYKDSGKLVLCGVGHSYGATICISTNLLDSVMSSYVGGERIELTENDVIKMIF